VIHPQMREKAFQQAMAEYQIQINQFQTMQKAQMDAAIAGGKAGKKLEGSEKPAQDESSAQVAQAIARVTEVQAMQQAPQPPPQPFFLPDAEEDRVMYAWNQQMQLVGFQLAPPQPSDDPNEDPGALQQQQQAFLAFRSVVDAYGRLAEKSEQAAMLGLSNVKAPGTPAQTAPPPTPGAQPPTLQAAKV